MKKKFTQFIQIAIMLFVFQMLMPNLTAQPIPIGNGPIGSNLNIDNNGVLKYWNGIAWITIAPGLPGQNLQFTNGNPTWINNPQGILTTVVSSITLSTAISGGTVLCDGGALINARGICWSTSHNPTILDNHTSDSIGLGIFTSNITGLLMGTTYYVRAYATNSVGTAYGNEVSFYVLIKDFDGNVYDAVTIGTQTWMKQNLKVTHYRNGDAIPNVTDGNAWGNLSDGAYCNYNNDNNYANIYGRLYNWFNVFFAMLPLLF